MYVILSDAAPVPVAAFNMQVDLKNCVEKAGQSFPVPQCENVSRK